MDQPAWQQQGKDPLFPEVIWARPERKQAAGKLLVIGGHRHGFAEAARLYEAAEWAGAGSVRIALPDILKPAVKPLLEEAVFVESTPSGSFSESGLDKLGSYADWADAVALIETGANSETSLMLNKLLDVSDKKIAIAPSAFPAFGADLSAIAERPNTLFVLTIKNLQELLKARGSRMSVRHDMGIRPLATTLLSSLDEGLPQPVAVRAQDHAVVVAENRAISSRLPATVSDADLSGTLAVWWMQQPAKPLGALAAALYTIQKH